MLMVLLLFSVDVLIVEANTHPQYTSSFNERDAQEAILITFCSLIPLGSFDPHLLVLLAYALAVADCFPEEIIREIFNVDFLGKLDSQLEGMCQWKKK